jgi:hypothetical protein
VEIQEIEVYIGPDGAVRLSVRGVKGQKCVPLTEELERLLGGQVLARDFTPEYQEGAEVTVEQSDTIRPGW